MPLKTFRPYTPSRRTITISDYSDITKTRPEKNLTVGMRKKGGRNNTGRIMVRHQGGGHKRSFRTVDFKREKFGVPARVAAIEYDPNRNARIALLFYKDGEKRYIPAPVGMGVGDEVVSGPQSPIKSGNALPLTNIPDGTFIHAIEMVPGRGAQFVRSAGTQAQLMAKEGDYALIKMPSGELRKVLRGCLATVGQVGNIEHNAITFGNAGRKRHLGIRPTVRGGAMNATDHPLGGGRGRSKGNNVPRSPWNQPSRGFKTRTKSKIWGWMIVQDRRKSKSEI
ncbi:MAG: large subunit ribosomal protein L2 [Elusimicrobia bacterium]|nr:MAG: large subunit ribosomal protein L2 [Elusimicrobiota bacterium]KAF0157494.1 MAG: large subunit ribosomal protein L2 [Elusimicrobiota bacterium]